MIKGGEINDINQYFEEVPNTTLLACIKNKTLVCFDMKLGLKEVFRYEDNGSSFFMINESQIWTQNREKMQTIVFELSTWEQVIQYDFRTSLYSEMKSQLFDNFNNYFIATGRQKVDGIIDKKIYKINYKTLKIESIYPIKYGLNGIWKILPSNKFLSQKASLLTCHHLESEEKQWEVSYIDLLESENAKQLGEIIHHNNRLYISLEDFDNNKLCCFVLSSETGEVLHRCDLFAGYLKLKERDKLYAINYKLGVRKKKSGGINDYLRNVLFTLDEETLEEDYIDLSELLDELDIHNEKGEVESYFLIKKQTMVIKDNYLYCHSENDSRVAVVDIENKKLVWHTIIEVSNYPYPYIKELKVSEKNFYILDAGGTLHVYNKEDELIV